MIPVTGNTINDLTFVPLEMTGRTFYFDIDVQRVRGITDGREAMRQAVYLIINTERYQYAIYSWNRGVELMDLIGQPIPFILPEIKRRVTEALMQDDRITVVDNWEFDVLRGIVKAVFTARTIYGGIDAEVEVDI